MLLIFWISVYPIRAIVPNIPTGGITNMRMIAIISRINVDFFIVIPPFSIILSRIIGGVKF